MRAQRFFYSQTHFDPYCSSEMSVNSKSEPRWEHVLSSNSPIGQKEKQA